MEPNFLGEVSAPSAGDAGAARFRSRGAGVLFKFNPPSSVGLTDHFTIEALGSTNSLVMSDYWLAATVAGEGALVTYFQV